MMKKTVFIGFVVLLIGFLLFNPAEAVAGSKTGLLLWFQSVVPVLLPFMILCRLLISWNVLWPLLEFLRPLTRLIWGISSMGTYALLLGYLCGYPMGAKIVADLVKDHKITAEEGNYLLCFCNNVSPAFLVGYTMTEQLKAGPWITITLVLLYGLPLLIAIILRKGQKFPELNRKGQTKHNSERTKTQASGFQISFKTIDACIMDGLETILKLGCYIILFSIMARLAAWIPTNHGIVTGIIIGTLEITNGIAAVSQLQMPFLPRYLTILGFLSFGGLSGLAQTNSVLQGSGLSTGIYFRAKLLTTGIIICVAFALITLLPATLLLH